MTKTRYSRRQILKGLGAAAGLGAAPWLGGCAQSGGAPARKLGRVIVVGGGYGGAAAAKYLRTWSGGAIEVVLIERNREFVSCPLSNLVLGGTHQIEQLTRGYGGLKEHGIQVIHDEVTGIDPVKKTISLTKIQDLSYDRLVVSPGVDFLFDQVQGLTAQAQETVLHAWKAGPQTVALRRQLEAMPDGGVVAITIPKAPYRCPPGPYERACQIAFYLKNAKPKSKLIILDANEDIQSKKGLFLKVWEGLYPGLIEYRNNWDVKELDAATRTITTELGDKLKADVLNLIPPMRAGALAHKAGLITANAKWCGVDWVTMESIAVPGVHVLGDATLSAPAMPKSGHMANQHGKTAAAAIVELLSGRQPQPVTMANTCYSFVDDKHVVHVASVHRYNPEKKTLEPVAGAGGLSSAPSLEEGQYGLSWAQNIWADMLS
jgi:sulfide dehydrogenase [flavocytochrome c] flavoprotein subunit